MSTVRFISNSNSTHRRYYIVLKKLRTWISFDLIGLHQQLWFFNPDWHWSSSDSPCEVKTKPLWGTSSLKWFYHVSFPLKDMYINVGNSSGPHTVNIALSYTQTCLFNIHTSTVLYDYFSFLFILKVLCFHKVSYPTGLGTLNCNPLQKNRRAWKG